MVAEAAGFPATGNMQVRVVGPDPICPLAKQLLVSHISFGQQHPQLPGQLLQEQAIEENSLLLWEQHAKTFVIRVGTPNEVVSVDRLKPHTGSMACANFTIITPIGLTGAFRPVLGRKTNSPPDPFRPGGFSHTRHCHGYAFPRKRWFDFFD